ncbi:hypothetical protein GCM10022290_26280 [Sagittula marina]
MAQNSDRILCLGLVTLAMAAFGWSFIGGGGINAASTDQPMRLPRILLGLWALLGVGCALRPARSDDTSDGRAQHLGRTTALIGMLFLVAVSLPTLGYLVPVTGGVAVLLWLLEERRPLPFAVSLAVLGPGLWALFHHGLGLRLPLMMSGGVF